MFDPNPSSHLEARYYGKGPLLSKPESMIEPNRYASQLEVLRSMGFGHFGENALIELLQKAGGDAYVVASLLLSA
jgi:hypothetical protein